jgi:hypothetical protein
MAASPDRHTMIADPLVNPVSLSTPSDSLRGQLYFVKATDDHGNVHDMIVSAWFATLEMTCPSANTQNSHVASIHRPGTVW